MSRSWYVTADAYRRRRLKGSHGSERPTRGPNSCLRDLGEDTLINPSSNRTLQGQRAVLIGYGYGGERG